MGAMMNKLLYRLTHRLPMRVISDDGRPYLERYGLFRAFGLRAYVHRFVGDDPARGLHDHPWPWAVSAILSGHYVECTRSGARTVKWFNFLLGDSFHRVILPRDETGASVPCWSLFVHRDKGVKPWGFWRSGRELADLDGVMLFEPYRYTNEGGMDAVQRWEETAPSRKELVEIGSYHVLVSKP